MSAATREGTRLLFTMDVLPSVARVFPLRERFIAITVGVPPVLGSDKLATGFSRDAELADFSIVLAMSSFQTTSMARMSGMEL